MHLERTTVGRKTPLDGKLEITEGTAERLRSLGAGLSVHLGRGTEGDDGPIAAAAVPAVSCTCAKSRTTGVHVHHFLESALLRTLPAGEEVALDLDPSGRVSITRALPRQATAERGGG